MGRGGYRGASTIVIPGSRKWQSEDFYALPLDPHWKRRVLQENQKAADQKEAKNPLRGKHITDGEVLRRAIMERNPALFEETKELTEARLYCSKNVGILK